MEVYGRLGLLGRLQGAPRPWGLMSVVHCHRCPCASGGSSIFMSIRNLWPVIPSEAISRQA